MSEQLFMEVKQKLDYYRLPTIFPIECTELLNKMFKLIDKFKKQTQQNNGHIGNTYKGQNIVESATRKQMGKVIKENNILHLDLMNAKEQIQSLKHSLDKLSMDKTKGNKQMETLLQIQNARQKQLFEQLSRVKYRYNQLIDMIHEDPNVQKQYIKRLLKHKKYQQDHHQPMKSTIKDRKSNQDQINNQILLLQNKIINRENQIIRLQNKLEYDGINMNKLLKDFSEETTRSKINLLNQQIQYLEKQNAKMKDQVNKVRKNGGSKEALREQVRKNHQQIKRLDLDNKQLKKKLKQLQFDTNFKIKENERQVEKVNNKLSEQTEEKTDMRNFITNLEKKVEFYAKESQSLKRQIKIYENQITQRQISLNELKNVTAGDKVIQKYQIQSLRRKVQENEDIMKEIINQNKKLHNENKFYKEEGNLKSEAIQNLQNIVQQLRRRYNERIEEFVNSDRNSYQRDQRQNKRQKQSKLLALNQNQNANQIIRLNKEIKTLTQKNTKYSEAYQQLSEVVNLIKREKQQLSRDKLNYMRQNDHLRLKLQELQRTIALREQLRS